MNDPSTKSKDWTFPDGYAYRQFANGEIQILTSKHGGAGVFVVRDSPAWKAITQQIRDRKAGNTAAVINASATVATLIAASLLPHQRRPARPGPTSHQLEDMREAETSDVPWGWIAVGVAGVVTLFALGRSRS